jgi:hypothetical protein
MDAARLSAPDAIGLISWNEFSENSHLEPSQNFGSRYLQVLADIRGATVPAMNNFDSSEPAHVEIRHPGSSKLLSMGTLTAVVLMSLTRIVRRREPDA